MCGIVGRLNFSDDPVDPHTIKHMSDRLVHRGPDDEGQMIDGNIGLGFRRLAIIDLSVRGHQPMSDETGEVWLVFNGEIYNFFSLRKDLERDGVRFQSGTDSEVIIHLYKKFSVECLQYLRGMFAFAIWDKRSRTLFVARDRLGKKPLKFYRDAHRFIFASELKAIFVNREVPKEVDWSAVDEYLSYQFVPHPKTGFFGIEKLEPAHYLLVKENGEMIKKRYWQLDFSKNEQRSREEWKSLITEAMRESVRLRLMSDVPLGAHLSGGIDSSLVVALMAQEMSAPVKTFSIGFEESSHNELPEARLVVQRYGTDHHEFIVKPELVELLPKIAYQYEEPFGDPSALPTWVLCQMTRQHVTVALNGDGGDENFAGYARYRAMQHYEKLRALNVIIDPFHGSLSRIASRVYALTRKRQFRYLSSVLDFYAKDRAQAYIQSWGFFREDEKIALYAAELSEKVETSRGYSITQALFDQASFLDNIERLMFADIHSYLPDDLLVKTDIVSMAHSLEVRSPLLDHIFMEQVAHMPSSFKLAGRTSKFLLKEIARNFIPQEIIDKSKRGFSIPCEQWLRTTLRGYIRDQLLDSRFLEYGFERLAIERLLTQHERGMNVSLKLWSLLMLRLWLRSNGL